MPEDVAAAMEEYERKETAHQVKEYRYKAYYSLSVLDGIEGAAVYQLETPHEVFEREQDAASLREAISLLPEKQARRIYAHYILGKSIAEIARLEGCHHKSITESVNRAITNIKKYFSESDF